MNFPYINPIYSVKEIMFLVIIACCPAIFTKYYFFGSGVLIQILFSIIVSLLLEIIILKIRLKKIKISVQDNSSILTAILFAISLPSLLPWWMTMIGIFFSIVITKHLYGGIGQNIFNPAMVGYVVLLISFPTYMNNWNEHNSSLFFLQDFQKSFNVIFFGDNLNTINNFNSNISSDTFTEATPLNNFKIKSYFQYNDILEKNILEKEIISFNDSSKYINVSFLIGGVFLLLKKIICWRIPVSFLFSLGFLSGINYIFSTNLFMSPLVHFFSGGTMICAFFIATDPVTTACTNIGKIIFGFIIGFLVWIIRNYSDYPDGIAFAVLFANMIVPLLDYFIKKSGYGHHNI